MSEFKKKLTAQELDVVEKYEQSVLDIDPIHEFEKMTGLDYKNLDDDQSMAMFATVFAINDAKKAVHKANMDSHWGISWDDMVRLTENLGFQLVATHDQKTDCCGDVTDEVKQYWAHPEGFFLVLETFRDSLNSAELFFEAAVLHGAEYNSWNLQCSHGGISEDLQPETKNSHIRHYNKDVREGFKRFMETVLTSEGLTVNRKWVDPASSSVWIYAALKDDKDENDFSGEAMLGSHKRFLARAKQLPGWVQEILNVKSLEERMPKLEENYKKRFK